MRESERETVPFKGTPAPVTGLFHTSVSDLNTPTMAAGTPNQILQDEARCPICLDFFTDPVMTGCVHNFCRACITQYWECQADTFPCPQCRKPFVSKKLKPNRLLVSVVEAAKQMMSEARVPQDSSNLCEVHKEELKLYCRDDERAICTICDRSRDHRDHRVIPLEEASEDYKQIFQTFLEPLRMKCKDLIKLKWRDEQRITNLKAEIGEQRIYIKMEMEKLHQQLNDEEEVLLHRLQEAEASLSIIHTNVIEKMSDEIINRHEFIVKIETKCQQPAKEFIKDAKDYLLRIHEVLEQETEESHGEIKVHEEEENYEEVDSSTNFPEYSHEAAERAQVYEKPNYESDLPHKKRTIIHKIQKLLSSRRSKDKHKSQDAEVACGFSAKAIYDYEAEDTDDLPIYVGDIITNIEMLDEGWWFGTCNENTGIFPANYVERL
ncbi:E3 ubiquitin-protein ligase TRIM39-like isoform X2 [Ambystoma mexicanum]|uniref:E3 ubiquitin-protein ligase TRIM39-like isoform X2 n=1 Tax=Ambystoma mexicanum TaxID=8296 RepID=UPI0037E7F4A4